MCNITRINKGLDKLYPKYYLNVINSETFLMAAKKRPKNATPNYIITMNLDNFEKESAGFLGKLRSNFMGTEFSVYDTGKSPSDTKNFIELRKQLSAIKYESNIFGMGGPRKMKIFIPAVNDKGDSIDIRPTNVILKFNIYFRIVKV